MTLPDSTDRSTVAMKPMNSWCRCRGTQRPMTLPSSTLSAANKVVVPPGSTLAPLHRQAGLRAVERLDLALLVDGDHHGMARRVHVEADDIVELGDKVRIGRTLEGLDAMRLQPVS